MTKYKQTEVLGESYVRAFNINIDHELGKHPSVKFQEEVVVAFDDTAVRQFKGELKVALVDFNEEFPVLNPTTGEEIGNVARVQDAYVLLHSYYIHKAKQRDGNSVHNEDTVDYSDEALEVVENG
jgi:hypothetical protein